jgi:prepilin-type N-terminal cleavage/methylation domain-containing protein
MMSEVAQRLCGRAGYSILELLTAVAIFGILAAAGLPHVDTRRQDINNATKQVVADYRWARTRAITSGVHFAMKWTGTNAYEVDRLKQNADGSWSLDKTVKTISLPSTILRTGWPDSVEFNTRGMMLSSNAMVTQRLWDGVSNYATWRDVAIWPSGQTSVYQ